MERSVQIMNLTARSTAKLGVRNPYTVTLSEQGDISNLCLFGWFGWIFSGRSTEKQDRDARTLLGAVKTHGNEMARGFLLRLALLLHVDRCGV